MGILVENLQWAMKRITEAGIDEALDSGRAGTFVNMCELGNQFLYVFHKPYDEFPDRYVNPSGQEPHPVAKPFFQECGFRHVSIDLNGKDGALSIDLSFPLDQQPTEEARQAAIKLTALRCVTREFGGIGDGFDIVTDFGTSEHVSDLYYCFNTLHLISRPGSLHFHVNPAPDSWPGHGHWYRDLDFYPAFAELTGYKLVDNFRLAACDNVVDGWNTAAYLQRSDRPFPSRAEFDKLPISKK